jgi:hypothetical protein
MIDAAQYRRTRAVAIYPGGKDIARMPINNHSIHHETTSSLGLFRLPGLA